MPSKKQPVPWGEQAVWGEGPGGNFSLTVRFIRPPGTPENHDEPDAVAQVDLRTDGTAFIHAAKSHPMLSPVDWRNLVRMLRRDWNVKHIDADRKGHEFKVPTERAELTTEPAEK